MSGVEASAEPAPAASEPRAFGAACAAALAAVVAHAFALGLGFHADDFHYLRDAYRAEVAREAAERGLPGPPSAPAEPTLDGSANEGGRGTLIYRPLLDVFWAALIRAQGRTEDGGLRPPSPLYEHGFSVLLKALTCFVVVFLARALGAPPGGPLFAGLVCALHAAPMNATTWVAARGDLCWALAGAFAWLSLERSAAPRGGGPPPGAAAFAVRLSVAAFVMQLGALGKETALAAAGLIGGAAVCARLVGRLSTARTVAWIVAMAAVVGATFALRHASYGEAAQRYAGRSGAPSVEALREFVCDEIPRLWKLYLGGRTVGPRGAEGHAAAATAAAFVAGAALFAGAAARLRAAFRCVLYLAAGVLSTYPVMIVVKGPEDEYVSREFTGYAVSLAVVAGVLFPRRFAGRAIAYGALAAVAAMFALEAAEYVEVDRGARRERERLDAALSEAGPGAELAIVHGGATTGGLMVPPESYATAAVAPFGRASVARQFSTLERAWTTRDVEAPDRLLFSRGVPTALALAKDVGPGAWRSFDSFPLVRAAADAPDALSAASESDGFARLRTPAGAPPRIFGTWECAFAWSGGDAPPVVRVEAVAEGRNVATEFAGPTAGGPSEFGRVGYVAPSVDWISARDGAAWEIRSVTPGVRLVSVAWRRDAALLDWGGDGPPTELGPKSAEPVWPLNDRTGAPYLRLVWILAWQQTQPPVRFVYRAPATGPGVRRLALDAADLIAGPVGPSPPLATLRGLGALWDRERAGMGRDDFPFVVRAEAAATSDGPPLAATPERVVVFRP